jgi:hypothetical protein
MQWQVRQQRGDIDSLYELVEGVEGVDQKVDNLEEKVSALEVKLDRRLDELSGQLAEVLRRSATGSRPVSARPNSAARGRRRPISTFVGGGLPRGCRDFDALFAAVAAQGAAVIGQTRARVRSP